MDNSQYLWHLMETGEYERAIIAFTEEFDKRHQPKYLYGRAEARLLCGEYLGAIDDLKEAIALENPRFLTSDYHLLLGVCYWYQREPELAVDSWRAARHAPYTDEAGGVQAPAILYYAGCRRGDESLRREAHQLLLKHWRNHERRLANRAKSDGALRRDFAHEELGSWPGAIVPYLLGKIGVDVFERSTEAIGVLSRIEQYQCQARFYVGLKAFCDGDQATFRERMSLCAARQPLLREPEFLLARWEVTNRFPGTAFGA